MGIPFRQVTAPTTFVDSQHIAVQIPASPWSFRDSENFRRKRRGRAAAPLCPSISSRLAPGSIGAIFGQGLATQTLSATSLPLPYSLANAQVFIDPSDIEGPVPALGFYFPGPIFFASPEQINFLSPPSGSLSLPLGLRRIIVAVNGVNHADAVATAPGLFTAGGNGTGFPAGVILRRRADGSESYEPLAKFDAMQNRYLGLPIDLGPSGERVFLVLFGAGIRGETDRNAVRLTLGGVETPVLFAGPQNGFVGLDQVNAEIPRTLAGRGDLIVSLSINGTAANSVTIVMK